MNLLAIALIVAVALLALWMRSAGSKNDALPRPPEGPGAESPDAPAGSYAEVVDDDDVDEDEAHLLVEMSGYVWLTGLDGIRRVQMGGEETDPVLAAAGYVNKDEFEHRLAAARARGDSSAITGERLRPGEFSAARLVRGAPDLDPWRLETLGPDGEYMSYGFGTEDAGRAALEALEKHRIVRRPLDDDDRPIPASSEDFEEGRRRAEESFDALESVDDEPGEPHP